MMTKKEFISQLTLCASRYADERLGDNNKLFASNQHLREDMLEWEQKYHSAMAANKKLEERNEGLQVEKQALLDVLSEWKSEVQSLSALNATLSEELQELKERCASQYQDFLKQEQIEALTVWKTGAESVLDTLEKELKDAKDVIHTQEGTIERLEAQKQELSENLQALKQINSFQEHRIEVLARKANKMRKKEQND